MIISSSVAEKKCYRMSKKYSTTFVDMQPVSGDSPRRHDMILNTFCWFVGSWMRESVWIPDIFDVLISHKTFEQCTGTVFGP